MDILTHTGINQKLCGNPITLEAGFSRVELCPDDRMAVDESGLVHGGFIFGLADYAAMIAVNHPNVVLGAADVKFMKPVRTNEPIVAEASVTSKEGKKIFTSRLREPISTSDLGEKSVYLQVFSHHRLSTQG